MNLPIPAYMGEEPYVFVCYAHSDNTCVYSDLTVLAKHNINVWYDEGIAGGSVWRGEIAKAILGANKLLFFISSASLQSAHCLREVDYAINNNIDVIPIYIDDSVLPRDLDLALNRVQALRRHTDSLYEQHLVRALVATENPARAASSSQNLRSRKPRALSLSLLAAAALVACYFVWLHVVVPVDTQPLAAIDSQAISDPYQPYQEGLRYVQRWDKGDNLDKAIAAYQKAISLDPEFTLAYARLAEVLRINYALTRDEKWLNEAAQLADTAITLNPNLAPVYVAQGRVNFTQGNLDIAFSAIEKSLSIDANDPEANQAMGIILQRQGRAENAREYFQKAILLAPENLLILDSFANFLFSNGDYQGAAQQWQQIITLAPDHYGAFINLGSVMSQLGKNDESIAMYNKAIAIKPSYMAYSNLGTAYAKADDLPKAIEAFQKALEINDADWLVWGNLAILMSWTEGLTEQTLEIFDRAISLAEAAREKDSRDPWAHSDLALYYAATQQKELALLRVGAALILSPTTGEIHAAAAQVYEELGDREKAIELALKALELGYPRQELVQNRELKALFSDTRMQPE